MRALSAVLLWVGESSGGPSLARSTRTPGLPQGTHPFTLSRSLSPFSPACTGPPAPKRLRIEIPSSTSPSPRPSASASSAAVAAYHIRRLRPGETRDTGIVSATEPGPSRGSLLRTHSLPSLPASPASSALPPSSSAQGQLSNFKSKSVPVSPIDPCSLSPHIPPHQPPINRETLKELDLDAILRNPQLRHDLLFDSGLQFRPTSSRRKRDAADQYWLAIVRELESGCTCTTLDPHGKPAPELRCACDAFPSPHAAPDRPLIKYFPGGYATVRAQPRLGPLLNELLEVLISIIQPPQTPALALRAAAAAAASSSASTTAPPTLHAPAPAQGFAQNHAHVAQLRAHLDPALILQELAHGLFDPAGVFAVIGDIIRCHCAPMRDAAVDAMVALARSCGSGGGGGTRLDAVRAIRMCFEIMELMKLDVANHQLQTLRPYLVRTAGEYEVQIFSDARHNPRRTVAATRAWLAGAWAELEREQGRAADAFRAPAATRATKVVMAVVRATMNLIFDPPPPASSSSSAASSSSSSAGASTSDAPSGSSRSSSAAYYAGYPETYYLDYGRLGTLSTDAADFTALYMLLMMYRQLVHSPLLTSSSASNATLASAAAMGARARAEAVSPDALARLKKEIWEIGPAHLGLCFLQGRRPGSASLGGSSKPHTSSSTSSTSSSSGGHGHGLSSSSSSSRHERAERDREAEMRRWRSEIEDVALQLARHASRSDGACDDDDDDDDDDGVQEGPRPLGHAPDMQLVRFAVGWTERNLRAGSPLSVLCKRRLRERVEEAVLALVLPHVFGASPSSSPPSFPSSTVPAATGQNATSSGLEPLAAEVKHLSQRAAKLVEIHVSVYGELYAHPAFLDKERADVLPSAVSGSGSGSMEMQS
ncbi:Tcp11-domain-containing protein [Trametes coccinea BRFM310]|uniref:Tcp11-domain-containing protein n=1 Tax=Trametes coccinea (strain BRFM310) TaxID=1353009 RepID=A0A1Y2J1E2_TRAC3|nr:Tcp11-domain-containing protein [Trametes coccinea BRFM310]